MKLYLSDRPMFYFLDMKILLITLLFNLPFLLVMPFIEKYIFSDLLFLPWLLLAMTLDLITGINKVVHRHGWSGVNSYGLRRTVSKVIQYSVFLILINLLVNFEISGETVMGELSWVIKVSQQYLIFIEAKSIKENLDEVNPDLLNFKLLASKVFPFLFKSKSDEK